MANLNQDYKFFLDNKDELVKRYSNKYLVISNKEVKGVYDREQKAYSIGVTKFGLGNFIIQYCSDNTDELLQTYQSRVYFA